jgi:hypothetical protein
MALYKDKRNLLISIFKGVAIVALYVVLNCAGEMKNIRDEYLLVVADKEATTGQVIFAEDFDEEVEKFDGRKVDVVSGYYYKFRFSTNQGLKVEGDRRVYGELPLNKLSEDIPYDVKIEYVVERPELNRIVGDWNNNETLFDWFRHNVLFKLIGLLFCIVIAWIFIKGGIADFKATRQY